MAPAELVTPDSIRGKKVLIFGVGVLGGGIGMARYMHERGGELRITDLRSEEQLAAAVEVLRDTNADFRFGTHLVEDIEWADIVIRNPGVLPTHPHLQLARDLEKPVEMELSYFFRWAPCRISAVTGTKGKTTTTTILHHFLGPDVHLTGNMGVPAITLLDELTEQDHVLIEISCYQLEGRLEEGWDPDVAVILNVADDHLDRYGTLDAYAEVKASLAKGQREDGWTVLPSWDERVLNHCAGFPSRKVVVTTGAERPAVAVKHLEALTVIEDDAIVWRGAGESPVTLCELGEFHLRGKHNVINLAFAAAAAYCNGVSPEVIAATVPHLSPVRHRLQTVGETDGVCFINDSAASAPLAVASAIRALQPEPIVLICGGMAKGSDFAPMVDAIEQAAADVILLPGSGSDQLAELLTRPPDCVASMNEAVERAFDRVRAGAGRGYVLLSPGCASFGLFLNEFDRGDQFVAAAQKLIDG